MFSATPVRLEPRENHMDWWWGGGLTRCMHQVGHPQMLDASGIQHLPRSTPSTTRLWIFSGKWSNLEVKRSTAPFTVIHQRASIAVPCRCCQALSSSAPTAEFVTPTLALHRLRTREPLPSARHSHCLRRTHCLDAGQCCLHESHMQSSKEPKMALPNRTYIYFFPVYFQLLYICRP